MARKLLHLNLSLPFSQETMVNRTMKWTFGALFLAGTLAGLTGCGGGGGSDDGASNPPPPPANDKCTQQVEGSTRLCDNPLDASASFDNFEPTAPSIDIPGIVSAQAFVGSRIFLKISNSGDPALTPDGQPADGDQVAGSQAVMFLGQVDARYTFSVPIHVPLAETEIHYEVFTDNLADATFFGEIAL